MSKELSKAEVDDFNLKLKHDGTHGFVTVWWQIARNSLGEEIEGAGFSGWGWGLKDFDPEKYHWKHFKLLEQPPELTVGHGMQYEVARDAWADMKKEWPEAIIDSQTFGAGAAVQRIYTVIRNALNKMKAMEDKRNAPEKDSMPKEKV